MDKIYYGAAYYPELWNEDVVDQDIQYMKEVGVNVVRMGEFAWATMEPDKDEIDVSFFVKVIEKLYTHGIETIFCTPTPTPPIWLSHGHPERMFTDHRHVKMSHGSRQHFCTNHPYFRERSRIIVEAIAKAIGHLPQVIAWQTDNEFKAHVAECFCLSCKDMWHAWLEQRYGTIDELNRSWGTDIWSERYQRFDQVVQPVITNTDHNASLSTAYRIFTREKISEFQDEQLEIIRRCSKAPITHNTSRYHYLDNELMFRNLDFAAFDDYPDCDHYEVMLLYYDLFRTIKKDRPFWVMETSTSHNGHLGGYQKPHRSGYLAAEAVAAYAMGAQGFMHWLWRQQRVGCEQPHGAVLSSWGKPTIGYKSVLEVSQARKQLEDTLLTTKPCQAEVAMTYSDRARAYFLTEPLENLNYVHLVDHWYTDLLNTGIHRDVLFEGNSLKGYKLVMTPFIPYLSEEYLGKLEAFVQQGGIWIAGPLTGGRTCEHTVHTDAGLGRLGELAGVEVVFTYPMSNTEATGHAFGHSAPLGLWSSVFESRGAEVMGKITGGVTPGAAFITEHKAGKGAIVLIGSMPQGAEGSLMLQAMFRHYAAKAGVSLQFETSVGTVVAPREDGQGKVLALINMDGEGGWVKLDKPGTDVISGEPVPSGILQMLPYEYRVIR